MSKVPIVARVCRRCNQSKDLSLENFNLNGGRYFRHTCKICDREHCNELRMNRKGKPRRKRTPKGVIEAERVCTQCGQTKKLSPDNFNQKRNKRGIKYFRRKCRVCDLNNHNEYLSMYRKRPDVAAKRRADQRWRRANDPRWRKRDREYQRHRNAETKCEVLLHYGGKCKCCGEEDWRLLTLDHVDGDGASHRREIHKGKKRATGRVPSGESLYRWLKTHKYPANVFIRVLCFNCNCGRNVNKGICPHCDGYPRRLGVVKNTLALIRRQKKVEGTSIMFAGE
jgi:hypothetical protein